MGIPKLCNLLLAQARPRMIQHLTSYVISELSTCSWHSATRCGYTSFRRGMYLTVESRFTTFYFVQTCAGLYKKRSMRNVRKRRAQDKQNYLRNKESKRQASRNNYWKNPDKQRASSRAYSLTSYWKNADKSRASSRASSHTCYWKDPESKRASSRASSHTRYCEDPNKSRASSRASSHTCYWKDPESKRASSRASSHTRYWEDPDKGRASSRSSSRTTYWRNPDKKRAAARITNLKAAQAKLKWYRRYYAKHGKGICASRRSRYALAEPKGSVIEVHVKRIQHQLLGNAGAKLELVEAFKKQSKTAAKRLPKSQNCLSNSS